MNEFAAWLLVAAGLWLAATDEVLAQQGASGAFEEITVTARKREESLQDVPISISVTSGAYLRDSGVKGLEELSQSLPAINISKGGASDQLYIRGIGSGFNAGFEQAVGTYLDGVYLGRSRNTRASFLDLDRLEVLKGPQTTFFGNSSIGGALSLWSRSPGEGFGGFVTAMYTPEFAASDLQAAVDIPASDRFRLRLAARKYDTDGYYDNTNTGGNGPGYDDWAVRLTSVWRPSDRADITFKHMGGESAGISPFAADVYDCPVAPGLPGASGVRPCPANLAAFPDGDTSRFDGQIDYRTQTSDADRTETEFDASNLTISYEFDSVVMTSVTGINSNDQRETQDLDNSELFLFHANQYDRFDQFSQELRLTSNTDGLLSWMAGTYYHDLKVDYSVFLAPYFIPPVAGANAADTTTTLSNKYQGVQDETTTSAFATLTYELSDKLRLNAGLRYIEVKKNLTALNTWVLHDRADRRLSRETAVATTPPFPGFATPFGPESYSYAGDDLLPSLGIDWDVSDNGMLYATFTQGFKAGGFNIGQRAPLNPVRPFFDEEIVDSFELGYKGSWPDRNLKANFNVFYSDYEGVQQSVLDAATFVFSVANAAASRTAGIEVDFNWGATDNFALSGSFTFMDAQFDEFIGACSEYQNQTGTCGIDIGGNTVAAQDLAGHETVFAPAYSGKFQGTYSTETAGGWGITVYGSIFITDDYHIHSDFDPRILVQSFERVDLRVALRPPGDIWEFAVFAKNLTDTERSFFCNDLSASPGSYRCSLNPPASVSLQVRADF